MKNEPLISVIIPVYNMENYVGKCLDSIISQTYKSLEIICIDDGSTDGSLKVIEKYSSKDSRIIVINQDNQGPLVARSNGIKHMHGEYFFFIDADDYLEENALDSLYCHMRDNNTNIAFSNFILNDKKNFHFKKTVLTVDEVLTNVLNCHAKMFPCWGMLINKCQIDNDYKGFHLCEDELYALDFFVDTNMVSFIDDPLIYYRQYKAPHPKREAEFYIQGYQAAQLFYDLISKDRPHLKKHASSRLLMHTFYCYLSCRTDNVPNTQLQPMIKTIKANRKTVLTNAGSTFVIKLLALISYLGLWLPVGLFKIYTRIKR